MRDKGLDYFENSRRATLANRAYAIANPHGWADYGENVWGLTASDIPSSYRARGAPPAESDDGTITPTAAGGSFAFTPRESLAALRHIYAAYRTQIWGPYGFKDAFNPSTEVVRHRLPRHRPGANRADDRELPYRPHLACVYAACSDPTWLGACRVYA